MQAETQQVEKLHRKAQLLYYMGYPREAKIYTEVSKGNIIMGENDFILDVSPEEYEKSGGMSVGLKDAETGMPEAHGKTIKFPYIITENDWPEDRREGALYASHRKFALQPILDALGVPLNTTPEDKLAFDVNACVGKKVKVRYTLAKDTRTESEGGTGREYPKAMTMHPPDTANESLGI